MCNIFRNFILSKVATNFSCMSQWVAQLFIRNYIKLSTLEMVFPSSDTLNFTVQGYWPERSWEEALSMTTPCQWLTLLLCHPNDRRYSAVFHQSHMTAAAGTRTVCDYSPTQKEQKCTKWIRKMQMRYVHRTCSLCEGAAEGAGACLYCSPNIIPVISPRRIRRAGHVTRMERERERERGAYRDLVGRPDGKRPTWKTQALMGG